MWLTLNPFFFSSFQDNENYFIKKVYYKIYSKNKMIEKNALKIALARGFKCYKRNKSKKYYLTYYNKN